MKLWHHILLGVVIISCFSIEFVWSMSRADAYKKAKRPNRKRNPNPNLAAGVARTRRKIKCRDSDVIVVTYPKSGTHWISSVLSQFYYAPYGGNPSAPGIHMLPQNIQLSNRFHMFPIYWLLPGTSLDNQILERSFEEIEKVPENIPRIFLSHMPVEYFEYAPTPKTKVIYMMRNPRAVWGSMLNMMSRRIQVGTRYLEGANATEISAMQTKEFQFDEHDVITFTKDFIVGGIRYPPRNADTGPMFAWNQHTLKWWNAISSKDPKFGTGTFVNYDSVIEDPVQAVKDLQVFLNVYALHNATTIAERASYEAVKDAMRDTESRVGTFTTAVHMPPKERTLGSNSVLGLFEKYLTHGQQLYFNQSNYAYRVVKTRQHPASALVS